MRHLPSITKHDKVMTRKVHRNVMTFNFQNGYRGFTIISFSQMRKLVANEAAGRWIYQEFLYALTYIAMCGIWINKEVPSF
jgi:hypothetical protein